MLLLVFFSARFSFSDLPDFLDIELRGDLSAMLPPSIEDLNGPDFPTVREVGRDPRTRRSQECPATGTAGPYPPHNDEGPDRAVGAFK